MVARGTGAAGWEASIGLDRPRLVRYCLALTGDADAAEDAAQETLYETWHSLTWSMPQVQRFWREHPRMRFRAIKLIEAEGSPAVATRFESLDSMAWIEVVALRDTCRVLRINGSVPGG